MRKFDSQDPYGISPKLSKMGKIVRENLHLRNPEIREIAHQQGVELTTMQVLYTRKGTEMALEKLGIPIPKTLREVQALIASSPARFKYTIAKLHKRALPNPNQMPLPEPTTVKEAAPTTAITKSPRYEMEMMEIPADSYEETLFRLALKTGVMRTKLTLNKLQSRTKNLPAQDNEEQLFAFSASLGIYDLQEALKEITVRISTLTQQNDTE